MTELTQEGQRIVEDAAVRHNISRDAVRTLLEALLPSGGGMAQFNHPDLGGMGQWSRGGMIMIGDMFNNGLKGRIDALCNDLSQAVGRDNLLAPRPQSSQWQSQGAPQQWGSSAPMSSNSFFSGSGNWWPTELGMPASSGAQNNMRYACFPERQRLAVDIAGQVSVYDTGLHWISGFSQQQGGDTSATFTSQYGNVRLDSLVLISGPGQAPQSAPPAPSSPWQAPAPSNTSPESSNDIFVSIERLAALRDKGYISDEEFSTKKSELLRRL